MILRCPVGKILSRSMEVLGSSADLPLQVLRCHWSLVPWWTPGSRQAESRPSWQTGWRGYGLRLSEHPRTPFPCSALAQVMPTAHLYHEKMVISQTIPDKPIEPLGLCAPVMDHVASPMPSHSCLQPHSLQEPQLGWGWERVWYRAPLGSNPVSPPEFAWTGDFTSLVLILSSLLWRPHSQGGCEEQ